MKRYRNKPETKIESLKENNQRMSAEQRYIYILPFPKSSNYRNNKEKIYEIKKRRSSNTYRQSDNNNNKSIKRKYETTSYEHPGRRKRQYENKSYQYEKNVPLPPKYYRNKPSIYNNNNNNGFLIAQKICNIIIKGGKSNIKKESIDIINDNSNKKNIKRMIEYEIEGNDYYNTEDINKKNKIKKKSYNYIIKMQKAQSFEQPRDYNYTNKQKNTKPKFVIGVEDPNDNNNKIKNNNISNKKTNIIIPNKINNNLNQNKNYIRNKNNTSISNKIYSNTRKS